MFFLYIRGVVAVFIDEDGSAVVVQGFPEKGLVGEAEDEEVARGRALSENIGDRFDV